ncbi:MAG: TonB-dependent receptor [Bacteroidota bacterium]
MQYGICPAYARLFVFSAIIFLWHFGLHAQTIKPDTTAEFNLSTGSIRRFAGFKQSGPDSIDIARNPAANLADMLAQKTPVFIRSYGLGGLATPSLRGTGASHTQTYWNGIALNSPLLGQTDLSLFPASGFNKLHINFGGGSLSYGTGGLGGSIHLDNSFSFEPIFKTGLQLTAGSFGLKSLRFNLASGSRFFQSRTVFSSRSALNNFLFRNTTDPAKPMQRNRHADLEQYSFMQDFGFNTSAGIITISGWLQFSRRNLAPPMTSYSAPESQKDRSARFLASMKSKAGGRTITAAFTGDAIEYQNTDARLRSLSHVNGIRLNGNIGLLQTEKLNINLGSNSLTDFCFSPGFSGIRIQNRHGLLSSANYNAGKDWDLSALLRQDAFDAHLTPFLYAFGLRKQWLSQTQVWQLRMAGNRNFHAPTLNDRYWFPGGNPNLKPETGHAAEAGASYSHNGKVFIKAEAGAYTSLTDNWILWIPGLSGFWSAQNVRKVRSSGLESSVNMHTQIPGLGEWNLNVSHQYTSALAVEGVNIGSLNKQLVYIPKQVLQSSIRWQSSGLWLAFEQLLVGKRYIAADNSAYLPAYLLSNFACGYNFNRNRIGAFSLQARGDNIFGQVWQSVAMRPMPLQSFNLTIGWSF